MYFNAFLYNYQLPYQVIDGRITGSAIVDGPASTTTHIEFEQELTNQTSWVGGHIVFSSGALTGIGAEIAANDISGINDTLRSVDLAAALPSVPVDETTCWLIRKNGFFTSATSGFVDLRQYIESVSFSTDINMGFDQCQISLNNKSSGLSRLFSQFIGMKIRVEDVYGRRCFSGVVVACDLTGYSGSITAVGEMATFGWYSFSLIYSDSAAHTSTRIIKDICATNPFIARQYQFTVDRNDVWHTAQSAIGGIGPQDFSQNYVSARDALTKVLDFGNYGVSLHKVVMQIWHDSVPIIRVIKSLPEIDEPNYIISDSNISALYDGISIAGDMTNVYTNIYSSYTTSDGQTIRTAGAYNMPFVSKFGIRDKFLSSSAQESALAMAVVQTATNDKQTLSAPGSIKITGQVKYNGSAHYKPVYLIKAGDILSFENNIGFSSLYQNRVASPGMFIVGHTDYSADSDTLNITMLDYPLTSELFAARIDI